MIKFLKKYTCARYFSEKYSEHLKEKSGILEYKLGTSLEYKLLTDILKHFNISYKDYMKNYIFYFSNSKIKYTKDILLISKRKIIITSSPVVCNYIKSPRIIMNYPWSSQYTVPSNKYPVWIVDANNQKTFIYKIKNKPNFIGKINDIIYNKIFKIFSR